MAVINGTSSSETLNGTVGDDSISGGSGNDTITGGAGQDTAVFSGNSADYLFSIRNGNLVITDLNAADIDEGSDLLLNVEHLRFADRTLSITPSSLARVDTTTTANSSPSTTILADGGWLVSWSGHGADDIYGIFIQRYTADGTRVSNETHVNSTTMEYQIAPSVTALPDGGWIVAWEGRGAGDSNGIFTQRYDSNGNTAGVETRVNTTTEGHQFSVKVTTLSDGGWLASWESRAAIYSNDDSKILTQRYDAYGNAMGGETLVDSTSDYGTASCIALPSGGWLITGYKTDLESNYGTAFILRYSAAGEYEGSMIGENSQRNISSAPTVTTLSDGGWIETWGAGENIHVQHYNSSNIVIQDTTIFSGTSALGVGATSLTDGGWLITWSDDSHRSFTKRYDADGNEIATLSSAAIGEIEVLYAVTTALPDGGWLLTWAGSNPNENIGVNTLRYDSNGNPQFTGVHGTDLGDILHSQPNINLSGGLGDDIYIIEDSSGWRAPPINELSNEGTDTVYSYLTQYTLANNVENGRIATSGIADLTGNSLNNILFSGDGGNTLDGKGGIDTASYLYSKKSIEARLSTYLYNPSLGYDTLINIENLTGSNYNDRLSGDGGNNVIDGGLGTDTASYAYALNAVTINLAIIGPQDTSSEGFDTLISIENLTGSYRNDTLTGNSSNNTIDGGEGDDIIDGGEGSDTLIGGEGSDTYYVDNVNDIVKESSFSSSLEYTDIVYSKLANYTLAEAIENGRIITTENSNLTGNDSNNILYAGTGNNALNGGNGIDTASYIYANNAITINLTSTTPQATGGSGLDTLISIENLTGSNYDDKLTGNTLNNKLRGGLGNDELNGSTGADNMIGGDGSDTYFVDNTGDVVSETNADLATGGTDTVNSYLSQYTLVSNVENGRVLASGAANMTGNSLNNLIFAGAGNNVLSGSSGNDTLSYLYASSAVTVSLANTAAQATGGSGADTLSAFENLNGSNYNDNLTGDAANNKLRGGLGNDVLNGGAGADNMVGGDGSDTYYVDNAGDVVSETNADAGIGGIDSVLSNLASYVLGANIENGRILAIGTANLTGNTLGNVLTAGNGNNVLNGGDGIDTASYAYATSAVTINLANTSAQATGGSGSDTLISIENLVGSNYNDTLTGNAASNKLNGGAGNDRLIGGAGRDVLVGGSGNDIFEFGSLADTGLTSDSWDVINDFVRGTDKIDLSKLDANTATSGDNTFNMIIDGAAAFTAARQLKLLDGVLYGNTDGDSDAEFAIQLVGVSSISLADFIA